MAERKMLILTKRARRVQEKVMQKLGKSDQTKDDVFQDFVANFNRQSATASKLQKELIKFMNAIRVLNQCTRSLGETIGELYEPGWAGRDKYDEVVKTRMLLWEDQLISLQSKMMEPMSNYISKFPEVKTRIQKRERKVVDYDLRRRELDALKTKQKVTDQKLQQAEEAYSTTKQLYDEITDELYEELPTFFDSRIQFYASIFQSLAATEARFHSEIAKVDEEYAGLMDSLASEAATAIHTTKKERTLDSTPKLLSRPGEDSDSDGDGETPSSPLNFPTSSTPEGNNTVLEESSNSTTGSIPTQSTPTQSTPTQSTTPTHPTPESKAEKSSGSISKNGDSARRQPPSKPLRSSVSDHSPPTSPRPASPAGYEPVVFQNSEGGSTPASPQAQEPLATPPPEKPKPLHDLSDADLAELDSIIERTEEKAPSPAPALPGTPPPSTVDTPGTTIQTPGNTLYKVVATHPYQGEDEDELSFEKGTIIAVVPYDDPEDEEEGWSTGVSTSTGNKGIFPDNFTKKLD